MNSRNRKSLTSYGRNPQGGDGGGGGDEVIEMEDEDSENERRVSTESSRSYDPKENENEKNRKLFANHIYRKKDCDLNSNFVFQPNGIPSDEEIESLLNLSNETLKFDYDLFFANHNTKFDDIKLQFDLYRKLYDGSKHTILDFLYSFLCFKKMHQPFNQAMFSHLLGMITYFFPYTYIKKSRKAFIDMLSPDGMGKYFFIIPCCSHKDENKKRLEKGEPTIAEHIFMKNVGKKNVAEEDCTCPSCGKKAYRWEKRRRVPIEKFLFIPPSVVFDNFEFEGFDGKIENAKFEYEKRINVLMEIIKLEPKEKIVPVVFSRDGVPLSKSKNNKRGVNVAGFQIKDDIFFTTISENIKSRNLLNFLIVKNIEFLMTKRTGNQKPFPIMVYDQSESSDSRCQYPVGKYCPLFKCSFEQIQYHSNKTFTKKGIGRRNTIRLFPNINDEEEKDLVEIYGRIRDGTFKTFGIHKKLQSFSLLAKYGMDPYAMESIDKFHNLGNIYEFSKNHIVPKKVIDLIDNAIDISKSPVEMTRFRKISTKTGELKNAEKIFHLERILPIGCRIWGHGLPDGWKHSSRIMKNFRKAIIYDKLNEDDRFSSARVGYMQDIRTFFDAKKANIHLVPALHSYIAHATHSKKKFSEVKDTEKFEGEYSLFRNISVSSELLFLKNMGEHFVCSMYRTFMESYIHPTVKDDIEKILRGQKILKEKEIDCDSIELISVITKIEEAMSLEGKISKMSSLNKMYVKGIDKYTISSLAYQQRMKSCNYHIAYGEGGNELKFAKVLRIFKCYHDSSFVRVAEIQDFTVLAFIEESAIPILSFTANGEVKYIDAEEICDIVLLLKDVSKVAVPFAREKFTERENDNVDQHRCFPVFLTKIFRYFEDSCEK